MNKNQLLTIVISAISSLCLAQISPAPADFTCDQIIFSESFESGIPADWTDIGLDQRKSGILFNLGWVIDRDTTFTPGTGPNGAQEGDFFVYCDGNAPIGRGTVATMLSPVIDIPDVNTPVLTFYLNMFGQSGSFQVNVISGGTNTTITPPVNGNVPGGIHGPDEWELIYVDLSAYVNQSIQLEFMTTKPLNVIVGDIAVDNITICSSPLTVPTLGQWGIFSVFLLLMILGVVSLKNASVKTLTT